MDKIKEEWIPFENKTCKGEYKVENGIVTTRLTSKIPIVLASNNTDFRIEELTLNK